MSSFAQLFRGVPQRQGRRRYGSALVPASVLLLAVAFAPVCGAQYCRPENAGGMSNVNALPVVAQAGISGAIGRDQTVYHATVTKTSARMETPGRALRADFSSTRVEFQAGAHVWRMRFAGYGYGDELLRPGRVAPQAEANRVEYRRGMLTEWYVNGPLGLEQGFTVAQAPGQSQGKPLTFTFDLSGDLKAVATPDRGALSLVNHERPALRYGGLMAMDASGRELRAWLEASSKGLRLRVDDASAKYPVLVDPIIQTQTDVLTACDGAAKDNLGFSIAVSGDGNTVVVGAPNASISTATTQAYGAAYVFLKPDFQNQGWNSPIVTGAAAKLIPQEDIGSTCGTQQGYCEAIGRAIAVSGDGSVIVVGAYQTDYPPPNVDEGGPPSSFGVGLVFVEPGNGWASSTPLNEVATLEPNDEDGQLTFSSSFGISPDGATIVGGSYGHSGAGAVYVFTEPPNGWASSQFPPQTAQLTASSELIDTGEGYSVAVSGDGNTIVAGGPFSSAGTVYVFVKPSNGWADASSFAAKLTASNGVELDGLGYSVSASGDGSTIVVGAPIRSFPSATNNGHAYIFTEPAGGWASSTPLNETVELEPSDAAAGDHFGYSVGASSDGSTIVVGAYTANSSQGAAYVFAEPTNGWSVSSPLAESVKLTALGGASGDQFGQSAGISTDGTVIVAGAPFATVGSNTGQGSGYVFTGTFRYPVVSTAPTAGLSFSGPVGVTTASQTVTLTNVGTATLHISDVEIVGLCGRNTCNLPFTTTKNCVGSLAPGAQCTESVAFDPTTVNSFTASLAFTDDGAGPAGSGSVPLSGTSTQAGTMASITSYAPDPALVGQPVTVFYSVAPPNGDTLSPTGTVTVTAATGENCKGPAPSGSCMLTFSSAVTRGITAGYGGDANFISSTSSSVSEQVTDFSLTVSPASQTIPPGHLATYTLTAQSINGFAGLVSLACGPQPPHSSCSVSPSSVTLSNSTQTANATINLENKGTYTLTFTGSDGILQHTVTVTLGVK